MPESRPSPLRAAAAGRGAWLVALLGILCIASPASTRAELTSEELELQAAIAEQQEAMVETLAGFVAVNTGTWNRAGLEAFAEILARPLRELGFEVAIEPGREIALPDGEGSRTGPLVIARREARAPAGREPIQFLLAGHYDTVFELDSSFQSFARSAKQPGTASGPGVSDMKGGIVVMLYALRALAGTGALDRARWTVLLNADEEIGSLGSRERLEREAVQADYGFVFEAAHGTGGMVRSRRGLGQFHLAVEGVAAHAGSAHAKGRSAVRELAEKVLRIEALTDYGRGVTLNVGRIAGGTKRNVVPERAEAWVDLRYDDPERGRETRREIERIAAKVHVEGTSTALWGTLHRPPKLATPAVNALLERHAEVARDLGLELPEPVHAGGGTDGSLMGAVGLPALDSVGVVGGDAHTTREFVDLGSLPERAAVAAILLARLASGQLYGTSAGR